MLQDMASPKPRPSRRKKSDSTVAVIDEGISHNLQGQRLGRKGRDTRERILAATERLLNGPRKGPISLSAVAREASLAMTTLYLYFSDLAELLLAVLEPVMAGAEEAYVACLRERWPDDRLHDACVDFVARYFRFWAANFSMLQLREQFAEKFVDKQDASMIQYRIKASRAMIEMLVLQMDGEPGDRNSEHYGMATILWTSIERLLTITRDVALPEMQESGVSMNVSNVLKAEARMLELCIRNCRQIALRSDNKPA